MFKILPSVAVLSLLVAGQVFADTQIVYPKLIHPDTYITNGYHVNKMYESANETGISPRFKIKDFTIADYKTRVSDFIVSEDKQRLFSSICMPKPTKCTKENANFIFSSNITQIKKEREDTFQCHLKSDLWTIEKTAMYNCDDVSDASIEKFITYSKAIADGKPEIYNDIISSATVEQLYEFAFLARNKMENKTLKKGAVTGKSGDLIKDWALPKQKESFIASSISDYESERQRRVAEKINAANPSSNKPSMSQDELIGRLNKLGNQMDIR